MTSRRATIIVIAVVAAAALAAVPLVRHRMLERDAKAAISRYDLALASATRDLDAEKLAGVAGDRQIGRVADYVMLLRGTGVRLESDLLALDVLSVSSEESTVSAKVNERWRFKQLGISTGTQVGETRTIERVVDYTLVRSRAGSLTVELALFADEDAPQP